jgi:hypothetical protein
MSWRHAETPTNAPVGKACTIAGTGLPLKDDLAAKHRQLNVRVEQFEG